MAEQAQHPPRILVTGASGFIGRAVVTELARRGYEVIAGSRQGHGVGQGIGIKLDVTNEKSVRQAIRDVQPSAVIHLVGIIVEKGKQTFEEVHIEGTRHVVNAIRDYDQGRLEAHEGDEMERPKATRYLHMSALGADIMSPSAYAWSKGEAEGLVRLSGLPWTIFRPSLVFGVGDEFFGRVLKNLVTTAPLVVPQIGDGQFPLRPVSVEDVAQAFAEALQKTETIGQTYALTGPQEFTFRELLELEQQALSQQKKHVSIPQKLMDLVVPVLGKLPGAPITTDQYSLLKAGNTASNEPARSTLNLPMYRLQDRLPHILSNSES